MFLHCYVSECGFWISLLVLQNLTFDLHGPRISTKVLKVKQSNTDKILISCLAPQTATVTGTGPSWSQEPATPSGSSTWVLGTQALGLSSAAFPEELAGDWIGSGATDPLMWGVSTPNGSLTQCATILPLLKDFWYPLSSQIFQIKLFSQFLVKKSYCFY